MDHPDAMQALLTGQIDAHFTSPPFQFQEKVRGAHIVGASYNYFGAHTFLVDRDDAEVLRRAPPVREGLLQQTWWPCRQLIRKNPDRVARSSRRTPAEPRRTASSSSGSVNPALTWTTRPRGLMRTATFMFRTNQLGKMPPNWRELVFPPVYPTKGS